MRKPLVLQIMTCVVMVCLTAGCGEKKPLDGDSSGIEMKILEKGKGRQVNVGDFMRLHLSYKSPAGKTLFDSRDLGDDFVLEAAKPFYTGSIEEGFLMLHEGDSARFFVSADSIYKYTFGEQLPPSLKPGDKLQIDLRLMKLYDTASFAEENERSKLQQIETESRAVEIYLLNNALPVQAVKPGVYYFELKKGGGSKPVSGDSVFIRYTGRFLSGEVFDGSYQSGNTLLSYRLGNGERLIEWERAVSTMREGSVARLVLCSPNAYGRSGSGVIPPNTPLVYDIELVRIKSTQAN